MKTKMIVKKVMGIAISAFMVLATMVPQQIEAYAAGEKVFNIVLGLKSDNDSGGKFTFPNAQITSTGTDNVTSLTISVDKGGIDINSVPNGISTMSDLLDQHETLTCYWNNGTGAGIDEATQVLKGIKYIYEAGMKVTVTVDGNKISLPSGENKITNHILSSPSSKEVQGTTHYYMYVPRKDKNEFNGFDNVIEWDKAYTEAKTWFFMGMQGYLTTITEKEEDIVLDKITTDGAWAGGSRLDTGFTAFDGDVGSVYVKPENKNGTGSTWYWVDGPEAGKLINNADSFDSAKNNPNGTTIFGSEIKDNRCNVSMTNDGSYSNWRRSSTNKTDYEPNNYISTRTNDLNYDGEYRLQVHFPDANNSQHSKDAENPTRYGWNDLPNTGNSSGEVAGYFVEFSKYDGGMDPGYEESKIFTLTQGVDHTHTYTTTADDTTDTITYKCTGCGNSYTITVDASDATYTGTAYADSNLSITDDITTGFPDKFTKKIEYKGTGTTSYGPSETAPGDAGDYEIIVTLIDKTTNQPVKVDGNVISVSKAFSINPRAITIKADDQTAAVGDDIESTTDKVSVSSGTLASGESIDGISITIDNTGSTKVQSDGTHNLTVANAVIKNGTKDVTKNYVITYSTGTLTSSKKTLTVTTPPTVSDITYGQKVGDSTITSTTAVVTDSSGSVVTGTWSWKEGSDDKDYKPNVGESQSKTWKLVFTPTDSSKYDPIEYLTKLIINPKPVSVTWSTDTYTYDGTDHIPTATVNTSDLVSGDTCTINVTAKQGGTDVDHPKYAGDYVATAVVSGNPNYIVNTSANTKNYSIGKKDITLTAPSESVAKDTVPTALDLAHINTNSGLVTGDTLTAATITHTYGANDYTVVGEHEISIDTTTVKIMSGSVDATESYNITIVKGKLTVGKKAPSDAENYKPNVTITYGDKLGDNDVLAQLTSTGVIMDGGTEVKGHWEWDKDAMSDIDDKMPHVSDTNKTYPVVFVPEDTTNYSPYKTIIDITVNPKEIDVKWDKDSFEYNGNEQSPIPTAKDGELIGNDTVSFTIGGKQTNVGDNYTAQITSTGNPDYVVKSGARTKGFKITPTSINPSVNPNIKITVTYDANDDEVVKIFDTKTGKELVPYDPNNPSAPYDYKYEVTPNPNNNEYNDVKITGHGNYSGNASKLVQNMKYAGQIRSIIDLDASVAELNPKMNPVSDDNAYALVERAIDGQQELKDVHGNKISGEQIQKTKTILNEIKNSGTSTEGSFLAVVSLEMKGLEEDKVSKQDVSTIADMIKSESKLSGMVVGEYIDLSLFLQYRITPANTTSVPEYVTQKIKIYDTTAHELAGHTFEQEVTVTIPQKLLPQQGHSRTYTVVRIHYPEGSTTPEKEILPTTRNGNNLTFKTGKFSTYAILYKDTVDPTPTPTPTPDPDDDTPAHPAKTPAKVVAPKTADTADLFVAFGMVFMGAVTLLGCTLANRRVNKKYRRNV